MTRFLILAYWTASFCRKKLHFAMMATKQTLMESEKILRYDCIANISRSNLIVILNPFHSSVNDLSVYELSLKKETN